MWNSNSSSSCLTFTTNSDYSYFLTPHDNFIVIYITIGSKGVSTDYIGSEGGPAAYTIFGVPLPTKAVMRVSAPTSSTTSPKTSTKFIPFIPKSKPLPRPTHTRLYSSCVHPSCQHTWFTSLAHLLIHEYYHNITHMYHPVTGVK